MDEFLSPELAESLGMSMDTYGENTSDLLITSKKKKGSSNKDEVKVTPAMVVEAKKMSKQQRKRQEQIQFRKEKEEKQSIYLQTLKQHEISSKDQELMQSVASIGQQVTHKQLLISSYKKHQAGIALSKKERDILFENGDIDASELIDDGDTATGDVGPKEHVQKDNRFVMKRSQLPLVTSSANEGKDDTESNITNIFSQSERKYARRMALQQAEQRKEAQTGVSGSLGAADNEAMDVCSTPNSDDDEDDDEDACTNRAAALHQVETKSAIVPTVVQTVPPTISAVSSSGTAKTAFGFGANMLAQFSQLKSKIVAEKEKNEGLDNRSGDTTTKSDWVNGVAPVPRKPRPTPSVPVAPAVAMEVSTRNSMSEDGLITINNNFVAEVEESEQDRCDNSGAIGPVATEEELYRDGLYIAKEGNVPLSRAGVIIPSRTEGDAGSSADDKSSTSMVKAKKGSNATAMRRVRRSNEIQTGRMKLPICGLEQEITECIRNHDVVILCGETGSGKTTQVPQFLYEAGYTCSSRPSRSRAAVDKPSADADADAGGLIVITQPRRVAAVSTAERVANELGCPINANTVSGGTPSIVGYQIRHDSSTIVKKNDLEDSTGASTRIKFVTDGVLLKEITTDLLLRNYSVVILDEAHERNVNTDILIGLLSRTLLLRKKQSIEEMAAWERIDPSERSSYALPIQPLKLVIMSATLRVHDFMQPKLFGGTITLANKSIPTKNSKAKAKQGDITKSSTQAYITANLKDPVNIPVITVESRQFTVNTHFARRTEINNYLDEVYTKTCSIHKKLPPGAILVFLTGKREISHMYQKLNKAINGKKMKKRTRFSSVSNEIVGTKSDLFGSVDHTNDSDDDGASSEEEVEAEEQDHVEISECAEKASEVLADYSDDHEIFNLNEDDEQGKSRSGSDSDSDNEYSSLNAADKGGRFGGLDSLPLNNCTGSGGVDDDADIRAKMLREALGFVCPETVSAADMSTSAPSSQATGIAAGERSSDGTDDPPKPNSYKGAVILQLHAMMSLKEQNKVFDKVKDGYRLIVLATNVAETSITIPGVRYVVDCGRVKEKVLNTVTGVSRFEVRWVSKASAEQRKGRAGRVGPGHVYRLYSSAFFDQHMTLHASPEILKTPLEDLILQMKSIGINNIESFPFPTSPEVQNMNAAIHLLVNIGALHVPSIGNPNNETDANKNENGGHSSSSTTAITNAFAFFNKKQQIAADSVIRSNVITPLGQKLVKFPIHPRLAKILVKGFELGGLTLLKYAVVLVSVLSEKSPFVSKVDKKTQQLGSAAGVKRSSSNSKSKSGGRNSKSHKRLKGDTGKDDYNDSSEDSSSDSDEDCAFSSVNSSETGDGSPDSSLHLEYHVLGDAIARLQGFYAFLHIISVTLVNMSGSIAMSNGDLAKLLLNPRLRKWAVEQTSVQVFCNTHSLHLPTLTRCLELFAQLVRLSIGLLEVGSSVSDTADFMTLVLMGNLSVRSSSRSAVATLRESQNIIATQSSVPVLMALFLPAEDASNSSTATKRNTIQAGHSKHFKGSVGAIGKKSNKKSSTAAGNLDEMTLLRQVLLAGFCDCIAKRVPLETIKSMSDSSNNAASINDSNSSNSSGNPRGNASSNSGVMSRRRKMTAYMSCNGAVDQLLYLHPHSSLYENDVVLAASVLPEYVVYSDLLSNLKGDMTYIMCTTTINATWIAQCVRDSRLFRYSPMVQAPAPHYSNRLERLQCYITPTYGAYNWPLPLTLIPMNEAITRDIASSSTSSSCVAVSIDSNTGFKDHEVPFRWLLRSLLEAQFDLPDSINKQESDSNSFKSLFRGDKLLLQPASITTVPPPKKFRDTLQKLMVPLVKNRITSKPALLHYLHGFANSQAGKNMNSVPFIAALQELFKPEFRQQFRQYWISFGV